MLFFWMKSYDQDVHVKVKIATNCYKAFDSDVIIEHRLTMREYEKHEKESYLIGKLDQCCSKSTKRCKNSIRER